MAQGVERVFGSTRHFEGIGVRCASLDGDFVLRAKCGCILADEKAVKQAFSVKGASGTKMCLCCKNIVGRLDVARGGYLAHHSWATPDLFDPHTDESFIEMVDLLVEVSSTGTRAQLHDLSQAFGNTFDIRARPFDEDLRTVIQPITGTYWDWMHILVASGGVFQYEANEFSLVISKVLGFLWWSLMPLL